MMCGNPEFGAPYGRRGLAAEPWPWGIALNIAKLPDLMRKPQAAIVDADQCRDLDEEPEILILLLHYRGGIAITSLVASTHRGRARIKPAPCTPSRVHGRPPLRACSATPSEASPSPHAAKSFLLPGDHEEPPRDIFLRREAGAGSRPWGRSYHQLPSSFGLGRSRPRVDGRLWSRPRCRGRRPRNPCPIHNRRGHWRTHRADRSANRPSR